MIERRTFVGAAGLMLAGCASTMSQRGDWTVLVDGSHVPTAAEGWTALGEGNWSIVDGTLQGKNGKAGYLVSKDSWSDFELTAEFWADPDCNSGIFLRCADRNKVGADNAYEVNIFDKRPDPTYGTAAIVDVAKVRQPGPMAANRWNTFNVTAKGPRLVVVFNGETTVDAMDSRWTRGPIALQSAAGTIRFRRVMVRAI